MERIRRRPCHRLQEADILNTPEVLTPEYLLQWGKHIPGSPLYVHLVGVIAADPELMRVLNRIEHNPKPNILFAGVHYLLARGGAGELSAFYPSLGADRRSPEGSGPLFRAFVLDHEEDLAEIGRTRYTQTNECRRCAALLPLVWSSGFDQFHLVDIGTSAGLNLGMDHFAYRWDQLSWGAGPVRIESELRGASPVPRDIDVLTRTGLDLNPILPDSEDDRRWLEALVWPEQVERRNRLDHALDVVSALNLDFIKGDASVTLSEAFARLGGHAPVVAMSSFALVQMNDAQRDAIESICDAERASRPVFRVSIDFDVVSEEGSLLRVDDGTGWKDAGVAHHHGEWVDLFDQARP